MGVLMISGSPRKNGNTELLLSILDSELQKNNVKPIAVGGESGQLTTINCLIDFYL